MDNWFDKSAKYSGKRIVSANIGGTIWNPYEYKFLYMVYGWYGSKLTQNDHRPKFKIWNMRYLRENLHNLELNNFIDITLKVWFINKKINKLYFI